MGGKGRRSHPQLLAKVEGMSQVAMRRVGARVPLLLLRGKKDAAAAAAPSSAAAPSAAATKKAAASPTKSGGAPARKETVRASTRFFRELNEESEYTSDTDQVRMRA